MSKLTVGTVQTISVGEIQPSPYQARKAFDEEGVQRLADSIRHEGLLQPITVRKVQSGFELIAGERRLRAVKLLGTETIEARVIQTVSEAEAAAKGLVENLQRENLNAIEEAQGFANLILLDPGYWTQSRIAEVTGKGKSRISESVRLLTLPEKVKEQFRQRNLTHQHGAELLRLSSAELQEEVAHQILQSAWTVRQTRERVNALLDQDKDCYRSRRSPSAPRDPLSSTWRRLVASPKIDAIGGWVVSYQKNHWNFEVSAEALPTRQALVEWFRQMAEGIASEGVHDLDSALKDAARHPPVGGPVRVPQTSEEETELARIAHDEGPSGVYSWLYGQDSPTARVMEGLTWEELGARDPQQAVVEIIASLRRRIS